MRLLRTARDIHVERHGGNEESFKVKTTLALRDAGRCIGLPLGSDPHEMAVEWLENSHAIEPDPMFARIKGTTYYRVTAHGLEMLRA